MFQGVIPPTITPFKENGAVDFEAHEYNVEKWVNAGTGGLLLMGSNSEAAFLSESEKLKLIKITVETAPDGFPVLAGTGMESTVSTIELTNKAAELGAVAALVLTPMFYKSSMTNAALIHHFTTVADQCEIPVLIYNVPNYTGINLSPDVVATLSQHPNIKGMKDSSGNIGQLVQYQSVASDNFQIMTGTASVWYPALHLGVKAAIMALGNCAPEACVKIQEAFDLDQFDAAERIYRSMVIANHAVTATFGIAGLKYAAALAGYRSGFVRSPLQELSNDKKQQLEHILRKTGVIS